MSLILPKTYLDKTTDGKYAHHNGKPKLSYSQVGSWKNAKYRPDYIKQYFAGISVPGSHFTDFGSDLGTYKEWLGNGKVDQEPRTVYLSDADKLWLQGLEYPENCVYEDLIVVDCGEFVMEGYIDRTKYEDRTAEIIDFKTGNIVKKKPEYEDPEYNQTTLYCYQKDLEGYEIKKSEVMLFGRAGNNTMKSPLKLTQQYEIIPTPYSRDRAEKFIESVIKLSKEISENYVKYLDLFG